eukprot:jgi/Botrbrau1/19705/Bobra.0003s0066.1
MLEYLTTIGEVNESTLQGWLCLFVSVRFTHHQSTSSVLNVQLCGPTMAAYYALLWQRDPFTAWMLQGSKFAVDPLLSLLGEHHSIDKLLLHRFHAGSPPSEEVLRAAIDRHLPIKHL